MMGWLGYFTQFRALRKIDQLVDQLVAETGRLAKVAHEGRLEDERRAVRRQFVRTRRVRPVLHAFMLRKPSKPAAFDYLMAMFEQTFSSAIRMAHMLAIDEESQRVALEVGRLRGRGSALARWSRLDPVKEWAFEQRAETASASRAAFIKSILPEVRRRAKEAGTPLTGSEEAVERTVTRWFREAGIK